MQVGSIVKFTTTYDKEICLGIVIKIDHNMGINDSNLYHVWWLDDGQWTEEEEIDLWDADHWEVICK